MTRAFDPALAALQRAADHGPDAKLFAIKAEYDVVDAELGEMLGSDPRYHAMVERDTALYDAIVQTEAHTLPGIIMKFRELVFIVGEHEVSDWVRDMSASLLADLERMAKGGGR